jgi:hypothetical protein
LPSSNLVKEDEQAAQDRQALEQLIGSSRSSAPWPDDAMPPGTRVLVVQDPEWSGPWRHEFTGTIDTAMPPRPVDHAKAQPGERAYFVAFDQPQHDSSDGGPYRKAEIWDRYLRPLAEPKTTLWRRLWPFD